MGSGRKRSFAPVVPLSHQLRKQVHPDRLLPQVVCCVCLTWAHLKPKLLLMLRVYIPCMINTAYHFESVEAIPVTPNYLQTYS